MVSAHYYRDLCGLEISHPDAHRATRKGLAEEPFQY